mmetsp:Transcript_19164/g.31364  ORF Transcript_19164/g.31364 Transcript_19164/m.31364 type:complete len:1035 (+) Transcript_19164:346-3450(+)|eukprot:CAMPEP_0184663546 /NCGR_PEP_ID=MMETSP0308-20130426/48572_1 /TAXON_ID=38269 /ORGANISM="Gloeochaete witrockiana, Strain SAG 46.84" /LENGTH=1034 /DNA_ID=CAMNT_0027106341 /DNA_START=239 /DNA_END=3343 /DNA_ORIENTATION=+
MTTAAECEASTSPEAASPPEGARPQAFGLSRADLVDLNQARDVDVLKKLGGVQGLLRALHTDVDRGISRTEEDSNFSERVEVFGRNVYPEPPPPNIFKLFWDAMQDTTIRILLSAALVSLILGLTVPHSDHNDAYVCSLTVASATEVKESSNEAPPWVEGTAIFIAVIVVGVVTSTNEYTKERQFRNLNSVKNNRKVKVVRGGVKKQISIYDVNVGEIVILDTGDQVPADGVFITGYNLETDESAMTGETDSIKKNPDKPFMMSGCQVSSGVGTMLVIAVGESSEWGMTLSKLADSSDVETPLQKKLANVAKTIGNIGVGTAIITFAALVIRWGVEAADCQKQGGGFDSSQLKKFLDFFIMAVTIVVVAVPEGLPLAVTISLAYSMKRMMKDNNLVRHLEACETMGGATNICSDKTGTLTENRMTVVKCQFGLKFHDNVPPKEAFSPNLLSIINEGIAVNSKAYLSTLPTGQIEFVGSKTECALLVMIRKFDFDYEMCRTTSNIRALYAFSSEKKRMSVIIKRPQGVFRLYTKGASETVLGLCTNVLDERGDVHSMPDAQKTELMALIDRMASQGLRTLCLAYRDFTEDGEADWEVAPETELTCVGLVGIKDPVRPEVPSAVTECRGAGIMVRMVTGDNILTAKHIARECGILTADGLAMEGPEFRKLSEAQMDAILPRLQVLARSSPTDKFNLVHRLRVLGEVVAVTGDGTNDAPALKEADVGMAMGISGTEVAKEASDVILMDDNFTSIVKAVMWGRCVYDNIRKFVQFQLTVNVVALVVAFISAVTEKGRPLKPIQLLWVNLIMDTMGALALGTEQPTRSLLKRRPYGRFEPFISRAMFKNIIGQSLFQLVVLFTLLYAGPDLFHQESINYAASKGWDVSKVYYIEKASGRVVNTVLFNTFVWCQIFNEINCRKLGQTEFNVFQGIFDNAIFGVVLLVTVVFQILIVQVAGPFFDTIPLSWQLWLICVGIASLSLPTGVIVRLIPTWEPKPKVAPAGIQQLSSSSPDMVKKTSVKELLRQKEAQPMELETA